MTTFETIENSKIDSLINHLIGERTLVKVSLPQTSYESLTLFTDVREEQDSKTFRIDPPKGLTDNLRQANTDRLAFEFTGPDQLLHRFEAAAASFSDSDIWFKYPLKIARYQMRDNFRVKVNSDSIAELEIDQQKVRMEIDNLSLGGAYCLCKNKFKPLFDKAGRLEDVTLKIALKNDIFIVAIDVVQVNRIEPHRRPKFFGIAFEFIRMQNDVRKKLVRYIYEMQRQFLQTRLKMEL
jgi:hypothetical protein